MLRQIIQIDTEKCNGCGACARACHEGAIAIVDGKARLTRDDYCDGMGDCLPQCPTGAISFVTREAADYDARAVEENRSKRRGGSLVNWPVQIKLAPVRSPDFEGADLLIAADCTAFALASVHTDFIAGRVTLIGCPKLDGVDYSEKLSRILAMNSFNSVTVLRMEVPCCGGLEYAVRRALDCSPEPLPLEVRTVGIKGELKD